MRRTLFFIAVCMTAVGNVCAQSQRSIPMPANYQDCMQPAVLESLVQEGPKVWGLPNQQTAALRALSGYFLCHAYAGQGEESCAVLQGMPDFEHSKRMGIECRSEYNVIKVHDAMHFKQDESAVRYCSRWCRLNKSEQDKEMVCPNVCRLALKELRRDRRGACAKTMKKVGAMLGADADYIYESTLICRQKFTPKLSDCANESGPNKADCKSMIKLLKAYSSGEAKRCPKDSRYSGVCKAMIIRAKGDAYDGPEAFTACDENGLVFTKLICDARKATGGLREKISRPKREGY